MWKLVQGGISPAAASAAAAAAAFAAAGGLHGGSGPSRSSSRVHWGRHPVHAETAPALLGGATPSSPSLGSSAGTSTGCKAPVRKTVCCIGAGAAGLACAKELLERGFDTTVLEARDGIGGVWRLDRSGEHVGVREEQSATSSKYYLGFSDFPIADTAPDFVSHEEYLSYLEAYATHFGIAKHIRFGHHTKAVRRLADSGWELEVATAKGVETIRCDALAICTGLHSQPDYPPRGSPSIPVGFQACVAHARDLKDARRALAGKRVVIVGGGETGAELAHVAAEVGKGPALLSLRRGMTVIGRYLPMPLADRTPDARTPPVDLNERRVVSLLPSSLKHFIFTRSGFFELRDEHPGKHTLGRLLASLAGSAANLVAMPFFISGGALAEVVGTLSRPDFWTLEKPAFREPDGTMMSVELGSITAKLPAEPTGRLHRDTAQLLAYTRKAAEYRLRGFGMRHYSQVRAVLEEYSGAAHGSNFFTKSDDFIYDLLDRSLEVRPGIASYDEAHTVRFEDGSHAEADVIVWCTGYQPRVPFLSSLLRADAAGSPSHTLSSSVEDAFLDGQELFKHVFHPGLDSSVAFIGFARPQLGAMPPIAELQARWFGAVLSGEVRLPSKEDMLAEMETDSSRYECKVFSERLRSSVDFAGYTTEVAKRAGCYPDMGVRTLIQEPLLWRAFWLGPVLPQVYRIGEAGQRGADARQRVVATYQTFFTRS